MRFVDIIEKKKDRLKLSSDEIRFWIDGVMNGSIPDYQSSAMLMAILLNGMDEDEVYDLTIAMANSGDIMDWSELDRFTADKHSTGGVGDKVSLILVPLMAECGINMVKMSGRGLGHTGGTVDKMES